MSNINKHGLSRRIPTDIAKTIRKDCGFGCVVCGCGIFEYEHIDPEFNDATVHDPACMTLLCPTCHGKVTKGVLSKESIWKAKENPRALQRGFSNDWFDFTHDHMPYITFGGITTKRCEIPLMINDNPILRIQPPVQPGTPFLLSGKFYDDEGNLTVEIVENEWRVFSSNMDMTVVGPRLTVKKYNGEKTLVLLVVPPKGIVIEYLNMTYMNQFVVIKSEKLILNGNTIRGAISDCFIGIGVST